MTPRSNTMLFKASDVPAAVVLLTRLPVPPLSKSVFARGASAAWAYPLAGALVGLVAAAVAVLGHWAGLPIGGVAALALIAQIVTTGALHEDGLADCADGFWGGTTRPARLEIMRDSRIGTYGVLALITTVLLRWIGILAVLSLSPWLLVGVAALSRVPMVALMTYMPVARPDGLSASVGQPGSLTLAAALLMAVAVTLVTGPGLLVAGTVTIAASGALVALVAWTKIGGQTGDVLGAAQQVSEVALLLVIAASL